MSNIDKTSSTPAGREAAGGESAARPVPKEAPVEASNRFSDLLSGHRDRQQHGEDAEQPTQRQGSRPQDRQHGDRRGEGVARPQGAARYTATGAPAQPRQAPVTASAPRVGEPAGDGVPRPAQATEPAPGDAATAVPGQGLALGRAGTPPSPRKPEQLPGPAEGLFRRPPLAPAAHAPASHDPSPRGAARGRPGDDPAGDAERLGAGGVMPPADPAAPQRAEPPLGVSAAAPAGDSDAVDIVAELADRILVAEPKGGQNEVRIRLNMDTLQGAEITLKHDANGLSVSFETPSPEVAERLAAARQGLTERLQEKTGNDVRVEIAYAEDKAAKDRGDGRGDGRSRNRIDYEPDSGNDA